MPPQLVTVSEIARRLNTPRTTVDNWTMDRLRYAPPFPEPVDNGSRDRFYHWADVRAWVRAAALATAKQARPGAKPAPINLAADAIAAGSR